MLIPNICEGHGCGEVIEQINVESWELCGKFLCADCVDDDFERRANATDDEALQPKETSE